MAASSATAILVVGMHRSGTSALAGALNLLGVPLGERLLEPGPDNPKGYWEHRDIVVVHERLLAALGSRWDDVRALPGGWRASDAAVRAAAAIGELVARDFAGKPLWAVKDPRLCRFLPLWFQVLHGQGIRPVVLFMARDPNEVAASIEARNHWQAPIGQMLWLRYVTEAELASRSVSRSVVVYDDLLDAPLPVVSRALAKLEVEIASAIASARADLTGFIDKADRHHRRGVRETATGRFAEIAQVAYSALQSVAHGDDAWGRVDKASAEFDAYWKHHGQALDALAGMGAKLAGDAESEWVENRRLASKLDAQIQWSEQAVQKQQVLQAANADLSSKLTAQINWSEQAVQKQQVLQAANADLSSKLTAQINWSEQAVQKQQVLQAANADLSSKLTAQIDRSEQAAKKHDELRIRAAELQSKLTAQINWSERAVQKQQVLQAANADLSSKLTAQIDRSEQAAKKHDELRIRAAELQSKLTAQINWSEQARQRIETLQAGHAALQAKLTTKLAEHAVNLSAMQARLDASESTRRKLAAAHQQAMDRAEHLRNQLAIRLDASERECERLDGQLVALRQRQSALEAELQAVYASRSWRVTRPLRRVAVAFGARALPGRNDKRNAK